MINSRLEYGIGFQRFPVEIRPGATVGETIRALAQLPLEATLIGRHPLSPDAVGYPEEVFTLAEGGLLFTPALRQCLMPREDRGEILTRRENGLLLTLALSEGTVCERQRLIDEVWDGVATKTTVSTHMSNLRRKLGENISPYVQAMRGAGFVLLKNL